MTLSTERDLFAAKLCDLIENITGIILRGATPNRLVTFAQRRTIRLGLDNLSAYLQWIQNDEHGRHEFEALINLVTNGLTAFWREQPQLDAVQMAMESLHTQYAKDHLTIWSVGCSSGEEPYTMAMIANESNIPASILGTDINTEALALAKQGVYAQWSLRRLDTQRQSLYFEQDAHNHWHIKPALRQNIYFQHHNLLNEPYQSANARGWDLILCRNVFIYLNEAAVLKALKHFASVLNPNGYLILGASEQMWGEKLGHHSPFRSIKQGAGYVFRLRSTEPGKTITDIPIHHILDELLIEEKLEEDTVHFDEEDQISRLIYDAIKHIEKENVSAALACCEAAIGLDPFAVDATYILGLLFQSIGESSRAIGAFKKVLFLNPNHWPGAFEMAKLYEKQGMIARAKVAFEQTIDGAQHKDALHLIQSPMNKLLVTPVLEYLEICLTEASLSLRALQAQETQNP